MKDDNQEPNTTEILVDALKRASKAHEQHEKEVGHADPGWPEWYAAYMTRLLSDAGYRIGRVAAP